jgi:peptidoglycan/xylan/chitin deacetylase (PgdA/CDA1 family)
MVGRSARHRGGAGGRDGDGDAARFHGAPPPGDAGEWGPARPVGEPAPRRPGRVRVDRALPLHRADRTAAAARAVSRRRRPARSEAGAGVFKVPTTKPVVFLTIDDGWVPSQPALRLVRKRHVPVTAFLIDRAWRRDPAYFRALRAAGASLEDHTLTHPPLSDLQLAAQRRQICGAATAAATGLGVRPTLLRPPYGLYDRDPRRAAAACHLTAVVEFPPQSTAAVSSWSAAG